MPQGQVDRDDESGQGVDDDQKHPAGRWPKQEPVHGDSSAWHGHVSEVGSDVSPE